MAPAPAVAINFLREFSSNFREGKIFFPCGSYKQSAQQKRDVCFALYNCMSESPRLSRQRAELYSFRHRPDTVGTPSGAPRWGALICLSCSWLFSISN